MFLMQLSRVCSAFVPAQQPSPTVDIGLVWVAKSISARDSVPNSCLSGADSTSHSSSDNAFCPQWGSALASLSELVAAIAQDDFLIQVWAAFFLSLAEYDLLSRHSSPRSSPALLRHPRGKIRLRPAARRCSASALPPRLRKLPLVGDPDCAALRVLVPPASFLFGGAPSKKAHLGTWEQPSLASVPAECPE